MQRRKHKAHLSAELQETFWGVFYQSAAPLHNGAQHWVCVVLRWGFGSKAGCWQDCLEKSLLPFLSLQNLTRMRQLRRMEDWERQLSPGRSPLPLARCQSTMAAHPTVSPKVCGNNFCPSPLPFYPVSHCRDRTASRPVAFFAVLFSAACPGSREEA